MDTDRATLKALIEVLDSTLGSGVWLEPGDYEALRTFHNRMAQAAEDVVTVGRRYFAAEDAG